MNQPEKKDQPSTLKGKITVQHFGDKAAKHRHHKQKNTLKTKTRQPAQQPQHHILNVQIEENIFYRPKTKQNRILYQQILNRVRIIMADIPHDVIKSITDELLAILKSESKQQQKKQQIQAIIGISLSEQNYNYLYGLAKSITDYFIQQAQVQDKQALMFRQQQVGSEQDEVVQKQQSDQDELLPQIKMKEQIKEISCNWLRDKLIMYNVQGDVQRIQQLIIQGLGAKNIVECENKLISLLSLQKIQLIKQLLEIRSTVYYTIRYQKGSEQQKLNILEELRNQIHLQKLLEILQPKKQNIQIQIENDPTIINPHHINQIAKKLIPLQLEQQTKKPINRLKIPQNAIKKDHKGYQEIEIPPPKKQFDPTQKLISIDIFPQWARCAFEPLKQLNIIQSNVYDCTMNSGQNMLVCAPTGAGKTNIAVMAIIQILSMYKYSQGFDTSKFKIVYIAPMKALVAEVTGNLSQKLQPLDIKVRQLTGDMHLNKRQIEQTQIIVATPQKWDIITRKIGQKPFVESVKLVIIDQIHLLHDQRGPVLQSIICRTIRQVQKTEDLVRIVGLSATLPNYADVGALLRVKKTGLFHFGSEFRPVPLKQKYIGITQKKGVTKMILANQILYNEVSYRAGKVQMIVFVHSRRDTVRTAITLKQMAYRNSILKDFVNQNSDSAKILKSIVQTEQIHSKQLKELLPFGFAIHHAGLQRVDRDLVEHLFADRHIQVLVSTSTLAWGVNLPAYTVIIKGTQVYSAQKGKWVQLSPQDILQMMGRAGRPKFDSNGQGIIITGYEEIRYYLSLLNNQMEIQSQLLNKLVDNLNAQIILGTVTNIKQGVQWLGYSYLLIRMLKNPKHYQISAQELQRDPYLIERRVNLIHSGATILHRSKMIKYDVKNGRFWQTQLGRISSFYYIKNESIKIYNQHMRQSMSMIELFHLFSLSSQFTHIPIRESETQEINNLIQSVPLPINTSITSGSTKINILLQSYISRINLNGYALNSDMVYIVQNGGRVMRGIAEIFKVREDSKSWRNSLEIAKMIERGMWGGMTPLRQFTQIPPQILNRIEKKQQFLWDNLYEMTPQDIGELIKIPKLGKIIHKLVHQVPRLQLNAYAQPLTRGMLKVQLTIKIDFQWQQKVHGKEQIFYICVQDCDEQKILYLQTIILNNSQDSYTYEFTVPLFEIMQPLYFIKLLSDKWITSENSLPLSFKTIILPSKFLPPTQLEDIQTLPATALAEYQTLARELKIYQLNQIQTQTFNSFCKSQKNVLLGASPGNGRFTMILFSVFKALRQNKKSVIIVSKSFLSNLKSFPSSFPQYIVLTGNTKLDSEKLSQSQLILSIPQHWDMVSRRWKNRKGFQKIGLWVVYGLQQLQVQVICSRMRYIFNTSQQMNGRIIIISQSLGNYKDISEWIGSPPQNTYNFHPNVRSFPVQIEYTPFSQLLPTSRVYNMQRKLIAEIFQYSPYLLYVESRKQALLTCLSLIPYSTQLPPEYKGHLKSLSSFLSHCLSFCIGYISQELSCQQRQIVNRLYRVGLLKAVVIQKRCIGMRIQGRGIGIMQGQKFKVCEVMQILGRMKRQGKQICKVHFLCESSKLVYYRKFIQQPYPLQSNLLSNLANYLNGEIVSKTIQNKQDCIDWITWSLMYRRLLHNPNYYNLHQVSGKGINEYLSQIIQGGVQNLQRLKCISVQQDMELQALNMGIICSFYYISINTLEVFLENLNQNTDIEGILNAIGRAYEVQGIYSKDYQNKYSKQLHSILQINNTSFQSLLIHAHINSINIPTPLQSLLQELLPISILLLHSLVDILSSLSYLKPLIYTMQLCQMIVQGIKNDDHRINQLPLTQQEKKQLISNGITDVYGVVEKGSQILEINPEAIKAVNRYPFVQMNVEVEETQGMLQAKITLVRDGILQFPHVVAPKYPKQKEQFWWVVIGEKKLNKVLATKRISFEQKGKAILKFQPIEGAHKYQIFGICDSYLGCDQSEQFSHQL